MIPKIIHYCWFGDNSISENQKKYIEKWKQIMPDYELCCWNESTIDINSSSFLKQAYEARQWAFVADYTRVYALLTVGGVYMDTDVEVLESFNPYLKYSMFTSYEYHPGYKHMPIIHEMVDEKGYRKKGIDLYKKIPGVGLMSAIIASEPNTMFMTELKQWYDSMSFAENRKCNYTIPTTLAIIAERYGFRYSNEFQLLNGNIAIFPSNVFADYRTRDKKSIAVHQCAGSWGNKKGLKNRIHNFIYSIFYKTTWIRRIYLFIRNKFEKYPIYYC